MADRPLRPATHRRLGRPLPHQQANETQAALSAPYGFLHLNRSKNGYIRYYLKFPLAIPSEKVRYLSITHPCATILIPEGTFSFDLHA